MALKDLPPRVVKISIRGHERDSMTLGVEQWLKER